jgi:hypothetical protein
VATAVNEYVEEGSDYIFFHVSEENTTRKIPIFPEFTIFVTGHGKHRLYLHRFGITDNSMCPC